MGKKVLRVVGVVLGVLAVVVAGIALHTAFTQGDTMFAGKRPSNLGVTDGRLAAPRRSPNCVSSQADPGDAVHYVAPLRFSDNADEAMARLARIVEGMERTSVVKRDGHYLYAEFRSKLLGFVDDVEFLASSTEGAVHVRSASRLGRRDFGVNRDRVETIRLQFEAASPAPGGR